MLVLSLAFAAPSLQLADRPLPFLARVAEVASVDGVPVVGATVVRTPSRQFGAWPALVGPATASVSAAEAEAAAAERIAASAGAASVVGAAKPVWSAVRGEARRAWRVEVLDGGIGRWTVDVDANSGVVRRVQGWTRTAESDGAFANYFPLNPVLSRLDVTQVSPGLTNAFAAAWSCAAPDDDPSLLSLAACERATQQAHPDAAGDYRYLPRGGAVNDPFAEVQAFVHADAMSRWLVDRYALTLPWAPIDVFVNFPLTNAFFGDFDADGKPDISFGNAPNGVDLGYDADVVYHELGHAVITALAPELPFVQADELGMDWVAGSIHEGAADAFAMILTGDPAVGEYAGLGFGSGAIRDLTALRRCPDDLLGEVHADGEIFGSLFWALIRDPRVGPDLAADLLVGAIPLWGAEPSWERVGDSLAVTADDLLDAGLADDAAHAAIQLALDASGLRGCKRVDPLAVDVPRELLVVNVGLSADLSRIPANVQLELPPGPFVLEVDDDHPSAGWTLFIRSGAPVDHEVYEVPGLGLTVAVPRIFDTSVDGDGAMSVDSASLHLDAAAPTYVTVASRNIDLAPLAVSFVPVQVTRVTPADAPDATRSDGRQTYVDPACGCGTTPLVPWPALAAAWLLTRRRTSRQPSRTL